MNFPEIFAGLRRAKMTVVVKHAFLSHLVIEPALGLTSDPIAHPFPCNHMIMRIAIYCVSMHDQCRIYMSLHGMYHAYVPRPDLRPPPLLT